ncbi:EpsG family protein [Aquitalea sp. ASV15]|uniref:EpsG family protein n=1 Tax=Aquitalea sp. ASV15 TaxID=2795104 RepID=UPI00351C8CD2
MVPASFLFIFRKKINSRYVDTKVWMFFAIASLLCIPLQSMASTATDRLALYLTPLQMVVYSRLPLFFSPAFRYVVLTAILSGYTAVLYVWLNYSSNALESWIPYKWILT